MRFGLRKSAVTPVEDNTVLSQLMKGRDTRWYAGDLLKINLIIMFLLLTSMSNGYDGSMMNGLQTLENWREYFDNPTGGTLGLFNAIQNIGTVVALPIAPYLNDKLGRRWTLFIGSAGKLPPSRDRARTYADLVVCIIGCAIQTAAQGFGMFIGARALMGAGNAWACIASPVLITEIAFPTQRAQFTSLYNSTWYLGSIVAAWTTFGTFRILNTWSWRIPSLIQGVPPLIQMSLILFFPESPRWLVDKGRDEEAIHIITKYHCGGNRDDPLVAFEYDEIKEALRLEKTVTKSSSYKQLFTNKGNLKRMRVIIALAFFSQWSGNGLVSYYLNIVLDGIGITSEFDKNLFNGILQIYNLGTAYMGALVVERAGRRTLFLTSTAGMCLTYAVWTACSATYQQSVVYVPGTEGTDNQEIQSANTSAGNAVAAMIFIYYGFYNIALSPLLVSYTVEILPFRIRSKGLMIMQICVSASLVFNQYVNPIALEALEWRYYIVYTVWLAFECAYLYFTVVETKGRNGHPLPLEEISALFDGDAVREDVAASSEAAVVEKPYKGDLAMMEGGMGSSTNVASEQQVERVDQKH